MPTETMTIDMEKAIQSLTMGSPNYDFNRWLNYPQPGLNPSMVSTSSRPQDFLSGTESGIWGFESFWVNWIEICNKALEPEKDYSKMPVLTGYIEAAMSEAKHSMLEDGTYFSEIASCPGVWANESNIVECMKELRAALEMWIVIKLRNNEALPHIKGMHLEMEVIQEWPD